jgi:hypothetical protein
MSAILVMLLRGIFDGDQAIYIVIRCKQPAVLVRGCKIAPETENLKPNILFLTSKIRNFESEDHCGGRDKQEQPRQCVESFGDAVGMK